jgi:hypothetical protein
VDVVVDVEMASEVVVEVVIEVITNVAVVVEMIVVATVATSRGKFPALGKLAESPLYDPLMVSEPTLESK